MSGPNHPRGTTNRNERGNTTVRRARKVWLLATFGDGTTAPCSFQQDDGSPLYPDRCLGTVTLDTISVDRHPVAGVDGGTYARNNIRPACPPCNSYHGGVMRRERTRAQRAGSILGAARVQS